MSLDRFINDVRTGVAKRFDLKTDAEIDAFFSGLEESAKDNQEVLEKRDKMWINIRAMWIGYESIEGWFLQAQCSNCLKWAHKLNPYTHEFEYNFCPSCGAKLKED